MSKLQEIFNRIEESKKEQKKLKTIYKDALLSNQEYQLTENEIKILKDRKKKIEDKIKDDFASEFDKIEKLKVDIESDSMLLSDMALTMLMKGETVEVSDKHGRKYNPLFLVKFKKN